MTVFEVKISDDRKGKRIVLLGDTETNENGGCYPDRVEIFNWEIDKENIKNHGLEEAFLMERSLRAGGICFVHEEKDDFPSAEECLLSVLGIKNATEYTKEQDVFGLPEGVYWMHDCES